MDDLEEKVQEENKLEKDFMDSFSTKENNIKRRSNHSWIGAVVLIFLGIILLLQKLDISLMENWWALFILIPAFILFGSAWNSYQNKHKYNPSMLVPIIFGLIFVIISIVYLFSISINWTIFLPSILIFLGVLLFINSFIK